MAPEESSSEVEGVSKDKAASDATAGNMSDSTLSRSLSRPSPVMFAGGSIQSMVTTGTPGPQPGLIGGAIGGAVGALFVAIGLFWVFHRIRNRSERNEEDEKVLPRSRPVSLASSRPVSIFSDTTVDSAEERKWTRKKLRRRSSAGTSLKSLRLKELNRKGGGNVVSVLENMARSKSETDLTQLNNSPTASSSSPTLSPVSSVSPISPISPISPVSPASCHTVTYPQRQLPVSQPPQPTFYAQHLNLPARPIPSQVPNRSIGGYAGATLRAVPSSWGTFSSVGVNQGTDKGSQSRRVAAEPY
ncbi:hypothetical protein JCM5353_007088 [Sporobolomyces roseus]